MRDLTSRVLTSLVAGAVGVVTVVASPPAQAAATTFTPSGGPDITFTGNNVTLTIDEANQALTCNQFEMALPLEDPGVSRSFRDRVGVAYPIETSDCTNPAAGETWVEPVGGWGLWVADAEVGSVSPVYLHFVFLAVETGGCYLNIMGTVGGDFNDATGRLVPTDSTLVIQSEPSGTTCADLGFTQGQPVSVNGAWTSSGLSITNP